jgi:hypothetical protein
MNDEYWSEELQTFIVSIEYIPLERRGILRMPYCCCCDMVGCIRLFERINDEIEKIETFAGEVRDTVYMRRQGGEWRAFCR